MMYGDQAALLPARELRIRCHSGRLSTFASKSHPGRVCTKNEQEPLRAHTVPLRAAFDAERITQGAFALRPTGATLGAFAFTTRKRLTHASLQVAEGT